MPCYNMKSYGTECNSNLATKITWYHQYLTQRKMQEQTNNN